MVHSADSLAQYVLCLIGTGSRGCNLRMSTLTISFQYYAGGSRQCNQEKINHDLHIEPGASQVTLTTVLPCKRLIRDMVRSLVWEGLLEEGMTTHSIILAQRIPSTEEPGGLQSIASQRVRHNRSSVAQHSICDQLIYKKGAKNIL